MAGLTPLSAGPAGAEGHAEQQDEAGGYGACQQHACRHHGRGRPRTGGACGAHPIPDRVSGLYLTLRIGF